MQCTPYREAVSARLDGELPGLPADQLDAHLARCRDCAAWSRQAERVTRRVRLAAAPAMPDLTATVLAALPRELPGTAAAARARLVAAALRLALLAAGVAQAASAWPALVAGTGAAGAPVHLAHEMGAWNLGIAAAFLAVAVAPHLAAGALPVLGTSAALLVVRTAADLQAGHVPADREVAHVLLLAGVALVATVAWRGRRRPLPPVGRGRVAA